MTSDKRGMRAEGVNSRKRVPPLRQALRQAQGGPFDVAQDGERKSNRERSRTAQGRDDKTMVTR